MEKIFVMILTFNDWLNEGMSSQSLENLILSGVVKEWELKRFLAHKNDRYIFRFISYEEIFIEDPDSEYGIDLGLKGMLRHENSRARSFSVPTELQSAVKKLYNEGLVKVPDIEQIRGISFTRDPNLWFQDILLIFDKQKLINDGYLFLPYVDSENLGFTDDYEPEEEETEAEEVLITNAEGIRNWKNYLVGVSSLEEGGVSMHGGESVFPRKEFRELLKRHNIKYIPLNRIPSE